MIKITLDNLGKQFNSDWIFASLSCEISPRSTTAILGSNGSGKSTLLQVISSSISPTLGTISYSNEDKVIPPDQAFRLMSISAPYIELIEEFTLSEMIGFHRRLKPLVNNLSVEEVSKICRLERNLNKHIKVFSSGMKQRVKLALAILSETPVLLLDEPTSNLDQAGIDWYIELVNSHINNRVVVVSSNSISHEYNFCKQIINLEDYKKPPVTDPSLMLF